MSAPIPAARFYDRLAHDYHLLYADWREAATRQSAALAGLIRSLHGDAKVPILDCACGIGTQALGLAALGYPVTGTDVSPRAVARAAAEARRLRLSGTRFTVADMKAFPASFRDAFDVAIGCDNPLAHLTGSGDLRIAFLGMRTALRAGGLLVLSSRDYDRLLVERPREVGFRHRAGGGKSTIVFQIWDWDEGSPSYVCNHFILEQGLLGWRTVQTATRMRAHTRREIAEELEASGFTRIAWHEPAASGFFQPIVTAVSPS